MKHHSVSSGHFDASHVPEVYASSSFCSARGRAGDGLDVGGRLLENEEIHGVRGFRFTLTVDPRQPVLSSGAALPQQT